MATAAWMTSFLTTMRLTVTLTEHWHCGEQVEILIIVWHPQTYLGNWETDHDA
ncbi:MAG: hypothetical protein U0936_22480 [Planctomycetaceae bacterium]